MPDISEAVSSKLIGTQESYSDVKSLLHSARTPRIGLYRPWTANLNEGWTRFVLDTFEFTYSSVRNAEILAGNLRDRYDCIILPSASTGFILNGNPPDSTEPEYTGGIGLAERWSVSMSHVICPSTISTSRLRTFCTGSRRRNFSVVVPA